MGLFGSSTYSKQARLINEGYDYNDNIIKAERAANPLQKAYAQQAIINMRNLLAQNRQNAAGAVAVAGGSAEQVAAQKQADAMQVGQAMGNIAAQSSEREMQLMNADMANKNSQISQLSAARAQQAQRSSALAGALIGGAADIASAGVAGYFNNINK